MRTTIVVIVAVLGLIGSSSVGTAQEKSEKKGTKWQGPIVCSSNQGTGEFWIILYDDSTFKSKWTVNCYGETILSFLAKGAYNLVGTNLSFDSSGTAKSDMGSSSRYTVKVSGKLLETTGSGNYKIEFWNDDWPPEESGTWEVEKVK